jgi:AcrR family transcriptional regulator
MTRFAFGGDDVTANAESDSTLDRILAAAAQELSERGVAGARIARIAAQTRTSKERVYAYFRGKDWKPAAILALVNHIATTESLRASGAVRHELMLPHRRTHTA